MATRSYPEGVKKFDLFLQMLLILTLFLAACGRPAPKPTSTPTRLPSTAAPTTVPNTKAMEPTPAPPPSVSAHTQYEYDRAGNLIARTDANGATVRYEYDVDNRLTRVLYPDNGSVSYAYDVMGRRTRMTDPTGTTVYAYDLLGRLLEVTDPRGNQVRYGYDVAGKLSELTYPDGSAVGYAYNADGLLTQVTDSSGTTIYTYDQGGRLTDRKLPNGVITRYTYDAAGRLIGITHVDPTGKTLLAFAYTLDAADRCTQVVQTTVDGQRLTTRYAYDSLGRLTEVAYPDGRTVSYTYDALGNRLTMETPEGKTAYNYDRANRLLSLTEPNIGTTAFTYDANGNLIERRSATETVRYAYDHENRLVRVQSGATTVEFVYDGDGNRVAKLVDGKRTDYVNDVNALLSQVLLEQGKDKKSRYTMGDRLLAQVDAATGEASHLLEDRLGSTVALTTKDGTVAGITGYDAFGLVRSSAGVDPAYGFTGERNDPETGLLYLRVRYYEPSTGRFVSRDPFSGSTQDPQSQNGYAYVANDPVNWSDPLGLNRGGPWWNRLPGTNDSVTRLVYDTRSRLITIIDPMGLKMAFGYDDRDHLVSLATATGSARYEYDQVGNFVRVVDPLGHATSYDYDALGRLTAVTEPSGSVTRYEYDAVGNLTRILCPSGAEQRYEYDVRGKLISEAYP